MFVIFKCVYDNAFFSGLLLHSCSELHILQLYNDMYGDRKCNFCLLGSEEIYQTLLFVAVGCSATKENAFHDWTCGTHWQSVLEFIHFVQVWIACTSQYCGFYVAQLWLMLIIWIVSFVCQGEYLFSFLNFIAEEIEMPSVLWHCWLGSRNGIRPVKKLE